MIGPLSTTYAGDLSLSSTQASILVATPILVGSLGRIVVGSLTDRYGGRVMFIAISLASIVPVLAVGVAGSVGSYPLLLVFGFFLGIAGTIFAVGIPFANNWYEASRRGFATGVFGAGMVGTARCSDGVIEGLEMREARFIVGVQWHPENLAATRAEMLGLFRAFVEACD